MRLLLATLLLIAPAASLAAWPPEGARVTAVVGEDFVPEVVNDGTGGAFVGWTHRLPGTNDNDVYLQRLLATGEIAPGWPVDGLVVAGGAGGQGFAELLPDGEGGVHVLLARDGGLYLQRITAAGTVAAGWPAGGVPVVIAPGTQSDASMVSDGAGGAWISWLDNRDLERYAGYYTHVLASGEIASGWPENGRLYEPALADLVSVPSLLATDDGGFLACVRTSSAASSWGSVAIVARRHGPDGEPSPLWPAAATVVCPELPGNRGGYVAADGAGGFFTAWEDYRNSPPYYDVPDVYAQHIRGDGTRASGWPADGLVVSALPGVTQWDVALCEDGIGGVYIAWEDYRTGYVQVYGQHLAGDGTPYPGWAAGGRPLSGLPTWQLNPSLVWDGADDAFMSWISFGASGYRTYVSKLTPYGTPASGWAPEGVPASTMSGHDRPFIASDGEGGAIVAWEQSIPGTYGDIYAQRFGRDGIVAASVSLVAAEATPTQVRLRWRLARANSAAVERRLSDGAWERRATLAADGEGDLAYTDGEVVPGTRYDYRLALADGTHGGLATVEVPLAFALALEGARPNPARGAPWVAFTLPDAAPARLELFDLSGRRVAAREVGGRAAGRQLERLDDGALAPGLYWAALTHGGRVLRTRVAIVR